VYIESTYLTNSKTTIKEWHPRRHGQLELPCPASCRFAIDFLVVLRLGSVRKMRPIINCSFRKNGPQKERKPGKSQKIALWSTALSTKKEL